MPHPIRRNRQKQFKTPTFDFAHKQRPPDDTPEQRAEKERLIAEFMKKREDEK